MGIFKIIKNKNGLSMVEILVAASIFFVLFTAVATTYAVGINLQYRTELSTSAELIGQFLLEYFTQNQPLSIVKTGSYEYMGNLPYPVGAYNYLNQTYPNNQTISRDELTVDDFDNIYDSANTTGNFEQDRYFRSEWAPHPQYFNHIFIIDGFTILPPGYNHTMINNLFKSSNNVEQTIIFEPDPLTSRTDDFRITIDSFPPFFIAQDPDLKYRLTVRESSYNPNGSSPEIPDPEERFYEVTIEVQWKVTGKTEPYKYEIKTLVPYYGN